MILISKTHEFSHFLLGLFHRQAENFQSHHFVQLDRWNHKNSEKLNCEKWRADMGWTETNEIRLIFMFTHRSCDIVDFRYTNYGIIGQSTDKKSTIRLEIQAGNEKKNFLIRSIENVLFRVFISFFIVDFCQKILQFFAISVIFQNNSRQLRMQGSPDRKPLLAQTGLIPYDIFVATKGFL